MDNYVEKSSTVNAAPVIHAKWINDGPYKSIGGEMLKSQMCSHCNSLFVSPADAPWPNHPYCAQCGARMDLKA